MYPVHNICTDNRAADKKTHDRKNWRGSKSSGKNLGIITDHKLNASQ